MTKNQFRTLCSQYGVFCRYSGHTKTMYISGENTLNLTMELEMGALDGSIKPSDFRIIKNKTS